MAEPNALAQSVLQELSVARSTRGTWEAQWEDVARVVLPDHTGSFVSMGMNTPGAERGLQMFDSTANTALFRFGSAMESMLTPRNGTWHHLRILDPALDKIRRVRLWCEQVNNILFRYRYAPRAAFQSNQHDGYIGLGAFGTAALFIDRLRDPAEPHARGLRYRNVPLGELYFGVNHQGQVDRAWRRFHMKLYQIAQRFGPEKLNGKLGELLRTKPDTEVFVVHSVRPRAQWNPNRIDAKGKPYESCYVIEDDATLLDEGGYDRFPYAVSRYLTAPNEIYGRSPAINVLPSIKVLNKMKETVIKQGERSVDPVLLLHDDGLLDGFNLTPGALNYGGMSADGRPLVGTLPVGNVQVGKENMDDERMTINDAFLVSLFQILVQNSDRMTATEVLERAREKGALLSPTMGRFQSESLAPMVEREYQLLWDQGLIPPPPPELVEARAGFHVEFDAPLNRAMRAESAAGAQRSLQFAAEIAAQTQDPSVMDTFDFDVIVPATADINGVPASWMASPEKIAAKRQGRQQQQLTQQAIDAGPAMAAMTKAAAPGGTNVNGG